jgi:hypothetical protein
MVVLFYHSFSLVLTKLQGKNCAKREAEEKETTCGNEARTGIVVFLVVFPYLLATDIVTLVHRAQGCFVFKKQEV